LQDAKRHFKTIHAPIKLAWCWNFWRNQANHETRNRNWRSNNKYKITMKILARIGAVLSFFFCLLGGLWILSRADFSSKEDLLGTAIGFYFVGKAFFVGPMLWLAAEKYCPKSERK
jgi:hypothetical protein